MLEEEQIYRVPVEYMLEVIGLVNVKAPSFEIAVQAAQNHLSQQSNEPMKEISVRFEEVLTSYGVSEINSRLSVKLIS